MKIYVRAKSLTGINAMKATVKYVGQSGYAKEDRYAEIVTPIENQDKVMSILDDSGWDYEIYGDSDESIFTVYVEDKDDYKKFMSYWKQAKRSV